MKITFDWLKDHLQTKNSEKQLLAKLTDIGLEVERIENAPLNLDNFIIAKIIKTEKHPNADRLKICYVNISEGELKKVVASGDIPINSVAVSTGFGDAVNPDLTTFGRAILVDFNASRWWL